MKSLCRTPEKEVANIQLIPTILGGSKAKFRDYFENSPEKQYSYSITLTILFYFSAHNDSGFFFLYSKHNENFMDHWIFIQYAMYQFLDPCLLKPNSLKMNRGGQNGSCRIGLITLRKLKLVILKRLC